MGITVMGKDDTGSAAWSTVPAGLYDAQIKSYESMGMQSYQGGLEKERIKFAVALDGQTDPESGEPICLNLYTNLVLTAKSSLAKLLADLGIPWQPGTAFDLDTVVGRRFQAVVKVVDSPNGARPQITDMLPAQNGKAAVSGAGPVAPTDIDLCKVEGCGVVAGKYTPRGTPLCDDHTADDL